VHVHPEQDLHPVVAHVQIAHHEQGVVRRVVGQRLGRPGCRRRELLAGRGHLCLLQGVRLLDRQLLPGRRLLAAVRDQARDEQVVPLGDPAQEPVPQARAGGGYAAGEESQHEQDSRRDAELGNALADDLQPDAVEEGEQVVAVELEHAVGHRSQHRARRTADPPHDGEDEHEHRQRSREGLVVDGAGLVGEQAAGGRGDGPGDGEGDEAGAGRGDADRLRGTHVVALGDEDPARAGATHRQGAGHGQQQTYQADVIEGRVRAQVESTQQVGPAHALLIGRQ